MLTVMNVRYVRTMASDERQLKEDFFVFVSQTLITGNLVGWLVGCASSQKVCEKMHLKTTLIEMLMLSFLIFKNLN